MTITFYSAQPYERALFEAKASAAGLSFKFVAAPLELATVPLAVGSEAICIFVNDKADATVLQALKAAGVGMIALRCAGYNNVDLSEAKELGIALARVPAYSPYAVAEHALALMLTLNRQTHKAFNRVREGNFYLGGLLGFDIHGKTVGLVGLGKIGQVAAKILLGFGCKVLGYDPYPSAEAMALGVEQVSLATLLQQSDIISLHCPLTPETRHMIDQNSLAQMRDGVMIINTSRGALIDTLAAIEGLKSGKIGYLGLDVYEEEASLFFRDLSGSLLQDDLFARLLTFPNVLITGHQGFFTQEAVSNIADTTVANLLAFKQGEVLVNAVV